jgi:hypothetical protein
MTVGICLCGIIVWAFVWLPNYIMGKLFNQTVRNNQKRNAVGILVVSAWYLPSCCSTQDSDANIGLSDETSLE